MMSFDDQSKPEMQSICTLRSKQPPTRESEFSASSDINLTGACHRGSIYHESLHACLTHLLRLVLFQLAGTLFLLLDSEAVLGLWKNKV